MFWTKIELRTTDFEFRKFLIEELSLGFGEKQKNKKFDFHS